jgi:hypothetical protein
LDELGRTDIYNRQPDEITYLFHGVNNGPHCRITGKPGGSWWWQLIDPHTHDRLDHGIAKSLSVAMLEAEHCETRLHHGPATLWS